MGQKKSSLPKDSVKVIEQITAGKVQTSFIDDEMYGKGVIKSEVLNTNPAILSQPAPPLPEPSPWDESENACSLKKCCCITFCAPCFFICNCGRKS